MSAFDIVLDKDFDLQIINGDLVVEESTEQHILLVMATAKGHWRQAPLIGARFIDHLNAPDPSAVSSALKFHLELDGMQVNQVSINFQGEVEIDGDY